MGRVWATGAGFLVALLLVVPALIARGCGTPSLGRPPRAPGELDLVVYFPERRALVTMALEEYVMGVLGGELPPAFEMEALKAQMVAARTYTVKHMRRFGGRGCTLQPQADACADPASGQAYMDQTALREKFGYLTARRYWHRLQQAAAATRGQILTFQGQPIDAVYHSNSGTTTEDAVAVWGASTPYLQPVSDEPGRQAPRFEEKVAYAPAELADLLGLKEIAVTGGESPVAILERTPGGRVGQASVGGKVLSGPVIRERLHLRSTNFSTALEKGKVVFTTLGYGHGLGLSQYGANGWAKDGKTYAEILAHYYPGTRLEPLFDG